jgi:hypothetical protein
MDDAERRKRRMNETGTDTSKPLADEIKIPRTNNAQWMIAAFLLTAFAVAAGCYEFLMNSGAYGHTSLMFIGIPLILAVILALCPRPKTATGSILRGITLALLVVAPMVGEGYLCILFAAPLFLLVGLAVGKIVDLSRIRRGTTISCVAVLMLPFCLEGTVPQLTYNRLQTVETTKIVAASADDVSAALAQSPDVATALPHFLRIGFPRPLGTHGAGLAEGSMRTIHFAGAEGDPPGDLVMQVTDARPGHVRFETISDSSKLLQWVRWRSSEVTYTAIDATHTSVTWRISFDRQLDPFWYFAPWERFAVRQAAGFLIDANATPRR